MFIRLVSRVAANNVLEKHPWRRLGLGLACGQLRHSKSTMGENAYSNGKISPWVHERLLHNQHYDAPPRLISPRRQSRFLPQDNPQPLPYQA